MFIDARYSLMEERSFRKRIQVLGLYSHSLPIYIYGKLSIELGNQLSPHWQSTHKSMGLAQEIKSQR